MSIVDVRTFDAVSNLISEFAKFKTVFSPVFLQYNGTNQIITLQYSLRTLRHNQNRTQYLLDFIDQYLQSPIQIPSDMYKINIYDQKSSKNLADNPIYYEKIGNFFIINIENLLKLDSDIINIYIYSKFKLNLNSLIMAHISKQPKKIDDFKILYQAICVLQSNNFPPNFQCLNIPISFKLRLNNFINYFIPKKLIMAHLKWYEEELKGGRGNRKKREYAKMIEQKYGISPLEFGIRIDKTLNEILQYIRNNYEDVIEIESEVGLLNPEIPEGYYLSDATSILQINLKFLTNFDNLNCGIKSNLIFNFKWMKSLFQKYFKTQKTY